MKTKKPTCEELEMDKSFWKTIGIVFLIIFFFSAIAFVGLAIQRDNLKQENTQLRENQTGCFKFNCSLITIEQPQEQDYHSSGELFCEHYGGSYVKEEAVFGYYPTCQWIINDAKNKCYLTKLEERFSFREPCQIASEVSE